MRLARTHTHTHTHNSTEYSVSFQRWTTWPIPYCSCWVTSPPWWTEPPSCWTEGSVVTRQSWVTSHWPHVHLWSDLKTPVCLQSMFIDRGAHWFYKTRSSKRPWEDKAIFLVYIHISIVNILFCLWNLLRRELNGVFDFFQRKCGRFMWMYVLWMLRLPVVREHVRVCVLAV